MACLTVTARLYIRRGQHRVDYDDWLLVFGIVCLGICTALLIGYSQSLYTAEVLRLDPSIVASDQDLAGLTGTLGVVHGLLAVEWTTIFAVKFSFLRTLYKLIDRVAGQLRLWYNFVLVFTAISWILLVSSAWIICPTQGSGSVQCLLNPPHNLALVFNIFITVIDVISDFLIVSIPVTILRISGLQNREKVIVCLFLCTGNVTLAMFAFALTRIIGYQLHNSLDLTWQLFWQFLEACIALIMCCMPAFRSFIQGEDKCAACQSGQCEKSRSSVLQHLTPSAIGRSRKTRSGTGWERMDRGGVGTMNRQSVPGGFAYGDGTGEVHPGMGDKSITVETEVTMTSEPIKGEFV